MMNKPAGWFPIERRWVPECEHGEGRACHLGTLRLSERMGFTIADADEARLAKLKIRVAISNYRRSVAGMGRDFEIEVTPTKVCAKRIA